MKPEKASVKESIHSGQPVNQQGSQDHQPWGKKNPKTKTMNSRTWERKHVQTKKTVRMKGIKFSTPEHVRF